MGPATLALADAADRLTRSASLDDDVTRLRYVSASRAETLRRLGLSCVRDVLLHAPHRYLDFTHVLPISHADHGKEATVVARVDKVKVKHTRKRMVIVELTVIDDTGWLVGTFFKQPWVAEQVHEGDVVALSGKVVVEYGAKQMKAPFYEVIGTADEQGSYTRVLPVHHVGEGISAAWMRRIVSAAIADRGDVCDFLPAGLVADRGLMSWARAVREIHFPHTVDAAGQARRRLAYDELLLLQLALLARRRISQRGVEPTCHVTDGPRMAALLAALPFELTAEQRQAADEILADMAAPCVMSRLLLGDVGTGKTAVAAVALAAAADTGCQAALMAPTSVLATQHAEKLGPVLDAAGIRWELVVGSTPAAQRAQATAGIASGEVQVVFGTTALLSEDVAFRALSLVIIDEQHRFGVDQRIALRRKGAGADQLTMTATPIPRTLALSIYGDLGCSRIRHRPRAGAGICTESVTPENLDVAYGAIREAVAAGQQAYVVCPLIDDADEGEDMADDAPPGEDRRAHSATAAQRELSRQVFPELRVGLLTGRMSADEKDAVMERFRARELDVLVSTTVIEVGVDVPNATVMLVYDADRFGLATLHQLRGRVGRGDWEGHVFLECAAKKGTPARTRLAALERTSDGFELAELDLKLRHEGEALGYRQHGGPSLKVVDLAQDEELMGWARKDALEIFSQDPRLAEDVHRPLAIELRDRFGAYFEEVLHA